MMAKFAWAAALTLGLSACAGDDVAPKEPVNDTPTIVPDAPGDAGETAEKPAGAGQAGGEATPEKAEAGKPVAAPASTAGGEKTVIPGALNVRSAGSMTGAVVRTLPKGAKVQVQSCEKGWCKIGENEFVGARHLE